MSEPDRAHTAWADERAAFAQFVTDTDLAVRRLFDGVSDNSILDLFIDTVLVIGFAPGLVEQRVDTAFIDGGLVAIERVARQPHHLAGFRDVAEFFSEIEQAKLVFDDRLVSFQHEGCLSWLR